MRRLIAGIGLCALLLAFSTPALAAQEEGDVILHPTTQAPIYEVAVDGKGTGVDVSMMVPVRSLGESMGWTVTWLGDGKIYIDTGQWNTTITIGQPLYRVMTSIQDITTTPVPYTMEMVPVIINGHTYAPLSLFCALLGVDRGGVTLKDGTINIQTHPVEGDTPANPMTSHKNLDSVKAKVGFDFALPNLSTDYEIKSIFDISGTMAEVYWTNGQNGIFYRVSQGTEYNSGVFMVYPSSGFEAVQEVDVFFRGVGENFQIAEWLYRGYSYSLFAESGLTLDVMSGLVKSTFG